MYLRNLWLAATGRLGRLQTVSDGYWRQCNSTYLASSGYYAKREVALAETLEALPALRAAIDIGCGDGRFTRLIAHHAGQTVGYDISPTLIADARDALRGEAHLRVQFEVAAIDDVPSLEPVTLVACMGVLSCLVHDGQYARALEKCTSLVEPGGYLLLVDTLTENSDVTRAYRGGYVARYRRVDRYEQAILNAGFAITLRRTIARMSARSVNNLYLCSRQ